MSTKINYLYEMIRRVLQIVVGIFIFDCPGISVIRNICYCMMIKVNLNCVISSKVLFYVPHGLPKQSVIIGNKVRISENVKIDCASNVTIEDNVWISEDVHIMNHEHLINGRALKESKAVQITEGIVLGEDSWIGAGAIILPKVGRIGKGAIIGAGSIVTKDVADYTIVAGNPAREIGNR